VVESVEDIQSQAERCSSSAEVRKVFAQTHVDVLVRERAGDRESTSLEDAAARLAPNVDPLLTAKCNEARPLYAEQVRDVCDPVGDYAMLLVIRRMLFDHG
jgi:hypothetical protein